MNRELDLVSAEVDVASSRIRGVTKRMSDLIDRSSGTFSFFWDSVCAVVSLIVSSPFTNTWSAMIANMRCDMVLDDEMD